LKVKVGQEMDTRDASATPDSALAPQPLGATSSPAQPAEVESIPAQRMATPNIPIPWLPEPADGDPRPWPTFALTPAQRALAAPAQAPRTAPVPRAAPGLRVAGGTPAAGVAAPGLPGGAPGLRVAPAGAQPGAPQLQPRPAAPNVGSGYAPNPGPGMVRAPGGFAPGATGAPGYGPRPYVAQPGVSPALHAPLQMAPPGRGGAQGLATSSLVLGFIGLLAMCVGYGFLFGIPGIITGHMALSRFNPQWAPPSVVTMARWGLGVSYTVTIVSLLILLYRYG